jgi:hypothetical protein
MNETEKQEALKDILRLHKNWMDSKKVGNIQVNYFKGGVTSINLNETVRPGGDKKN